MKADAIQPIHESLRLKVGPALVPRGMSRVRLPWEQADNATKIALDIFTDAVNVGAPFQDALLAVYLSGIDHGLNANRDSTQGRDDAEL